MVGVAREMTKFPVKRERGVVGQHRRRGVKARRERTNRASSVKGEGEGLSIEGGQGRESQSRRGIGGKGANGKKRTLVAARHCETCRTAPGKTSALTTQGVPFQVTA
jgi:hypothetical protein